MKPDDRPRTIALAVWMLAAAGAGAAAGPGSPAAYRFEAAPRPVLAAVVRAPSWDPKLGLRGSGPLYLLAVYGSPEHTRLGLTVSNDGGATFGKNVQVAAGACHCSRPALAFGTEGEVFVAWRTVLLGNIRDVAVAASYDQGETFGPQVRVAQDNWRIDGCPRSGPTLAVK